MRQLIVVLALILMIASLPVLADAGDKIVRFGAAYASPTGELTDSYDDPPYYYRYDIEADSAVYLFTGFEYMFTDLFGLDATLMHGNHDLDSHGFETYDGELIWDESFTFADFNIMPLFISAHFHFARDKPYDLYAGPTIGYVMYGDLEYHEDYLKEYSLEIDDDFGVGAVFGIDAPFGSKGWAFASAIRYIKTSAEVSVEESTETVDIDPWILQAGFAKRF